MPKLNKKLAKQTAEQESGSFEPVPAGPYLATLLKVTPKEGAAGTYWNWEYRVDEPAKFAGRRLFNNTSLAEQALFKLNETFKAFGQPTDTDTDELCGEQVKVIVSVVTIQSGSRKGEKGNQIDRVLPVGKGLEKGDDEPDEDPKSAKKKKGKGGDGDGAVAAAKGGKADLDEDPF